MRRPLLIALLAAVVAALSVSAVTLAGGRDTDRSDRRAAKADRSERSAPARDAHRGMHRMVRREVLRGLADRLEVTPRELRAALRGVKRRSLERAVQRGTITAEQRALVDTCLADRRSCDRTAIRPVLRALRADARPAAWPERKRELAEDLAAELGREPADVVAAVRAELDEKLGMAVTFGVVSERGRELALACFDDPASCDVAALRAEVRFRHGHDRRGR